VPIVDWVRSRLGSEASREASPWLRCPSCGEVIHRRDVEANLSLCTRCSHAFRMRAADRIAMLIDGPFEEWAGDVVGGDPLQWIDKRAYPAKLAADRAKSGLSEAIVTGFGCLAGFPIALGVMDFAFRGGTMGTVVGERIARLLGESQRRSLPAILCTASGGARMEEGMLALMQMAKTSVAVRRFVDAGNLLITVLTDPTTGGVSASFAFQADLIVAEAGASIGFAGRRVIEQTIRQRLPDRFQTAEFLLEKGQVDAVVSRRDLKATLARFLDYAGANEPRTSFAGAGDTVSCL